MSESIEIMSAPQQSKQKPPVSPMMNREDREPPLVSPVSAVAAMAKDRTSEAARQLFCGGVAGAVAKTLTAPLSRLTILFQVHSMVTTRGHRPKFAMSMSSGFGKMIERGGLISLWKGNMTSVLHRFPYSAINFYVYENSLDLISGKDRHRRHIEERPETQRQLVRRMSKIVMTRENLRDDEDDDDRPHFRGGERYRGGDALAVHKFLAGAMAGTAACLACYPLDLVRTRLTTQLEGHEHYRGIVDAFTKIYRSEGWAGFFSGVGPTLLVAVPNFSISYTVYGTLKEHALDDELFYNFRRIDADSGEPKLGFLLTVLCGAFSGALATLITFPMDTIRRRMQIQNLHTSPPERMTAQQQFYNLVHREGLSSLYRGLTPELLKVIPMVGTMFMVYEWTKELLDV